MPAQYFKGHGETVKNNGRLFDKLVVIRLLILLTFIFSSKLFAFLQVGEVIDIGDERYLVTQPLGKGAIKGTFKAERLNCLKNCDVVLGVNLDPDPTMIFWNSLPYNDQAAKIDSPHVRREFPHALATSQTRPGAVNIHVMEYGLGDLERSRPKLDYKDLRLLMEDAYMGAKALEDAGLINTDIKPANLMIMGKSFDTVDIHSGQTYLAIADHDMLYPTNYKLKGKELLRTHVYSPPEFFLPKGSELNAKSSLWQISVSFYEMMTGKDLFTPLEIDEFQYIYNYDSAVKDRHLDIISKYQRKITEVENEIEELIKAHLAKGDKASAKALSELKILIGNGLSLNVNQRQYWPKNVKLRRPGKVHVTNRLQIPQQHLMRSIKQYNQNSTKMEAFRTANPIPYSNIPSTKSSTDPDCLPQTVRNTIHLTDKDLLEVRPD